MTVPEVDGFRRKLAGNILLKNGKEVVNLTGYMLVSGEESRFSGADPEYVLQKTENRHLLVMGQALKTEKKENQDEAI